MGASTSGRQTGDEPDKKKRKHSIFDIDAESQRLRRCCTILDFILLNAFRTSLNVRKM
jgi:hypothetical protein